MDQAFLFTILEYAPSTGVFLNRKSRGRAAAGSIAGVVHTKSGYRYITIAGKKYAAHRLAFLYMIGRMPRQEVDHINGGKDDNAWLNLREADRFKNLANAKPRRAGLKGVYKARHGYVARLMHKRHTYHLGSFKTEIEAHAAYAAKAKELNGEFARVA